jgi:hypothetical protein
MSTRPTATLACAIALAAFCQTASGRSITLPGRPTELTSIDLENDWRTTSDPEFPVAAYRAFPRDTREFLREYPDYFFRFLFVDLNWDGTKEILVADPSASGSGGQAYIVLRKIGKTWKLIGEFQGGFVLSVRDDLVKYKDDFYRITTYYRSGDTYQNTYDFRNGRYRGTGQVMIPKVITDSCWWDPFWSRLNGSPEANGSIRHQKYPPPHIGPCKQSDSR